MTASVVADGQQRALGERHGSEPLGHAVPAALVLLLMGLGTYPVPLLTRIRATASMATR